ncbi:MAG: hypothetical protein HFE39_02200 [Clostridiales bacterium]|nr:hypothetical protein [Clostridiales bacterium]
MDEIREIYNREVYDPFLEYCERNNYRTMRDLIRFPFGPLALSKELSPALLNRVKTTFYMYLKKHPEILRKAAQKPAADAVQLEPELKQYFAQNANKLIHITDIMKALGSGCKRVDVQQVLEQAVWCKVVDKSTYFYAPEN